MSKKHIEAETLSDQLPCGENVKEDALVSFAESKLRDGDYEGAANYARQALAIDENNRYALYQLGCALTAQLEIRKALSIFERLKDEGYRHSFIYERLSYVSLLIGNYNAALKYAKTAVRLDSADKKSLLSEVNALFALNEVAEAKSLLVRITQENPSYDHAWYILLNTLLSEGDYEVFRKQYGVASNAANESPYILLADAKYLHCIDQEKKSLEVAEKIIQQFPDFMPAYHFTSEQLFNAGMKEQAIDLLFKAIEIIPYDLMTWKLIGASFFRIKQHENALLWLHRALLADSGDIEIAIMYANTLHNIHEYSGAADIYQQIITDRHSDAKLMANYAATLMELERVDEAESLLESAVALCPGSVPMQTNLAIAYNATGKKEKAISLLLNIIKQHPDNCFAYFLYSNIHTFSKKDQIIEDMSHLNSHVKDDGQKEYLSFALAKAYEDIQSYANSACYISDANALHRKHEAYDGEDEQKIEMIKTVFTKGYLDKYKNEGLSSNLPIFIVGMPRSGTTLVEQILSAHPNVVGAGERPYMGQIIDDHAAMVDDESIVSLSSLTNEQIKELGERYLSALKVHAPEACHIIDKMPHNYLYIGLIHLLFPNAAIIHCVRNPLDVCFSCFKHRFSSGHAYSYDLITLGHYYKQYQSLMEYWHKLLPGRIYDLRYEEVVSDFDAQVDLLLKACGLDWSESCLEFYRSRRGVRTASQSQVRQPVYNKSIGAWKNYDELLLPLKQTLSI